MEEERQIVLLALAHLAIERPGWSDAIEEIAGKLDNPDLRLYRELVKLAKPPERSPCDELFTGGTAAGPG